MSKHDFSDEFFNDTPSRKCNRCHARDGNPKNPLIALGSTGGAQLWICAACKKERDKKALDRRFQAQHRRIESERRDRYEEPNRRR